MPQIVSHKTLEFYTVCSREPKGVFFIQKHLTASSGSINIY